MILPISLMTLRDSLVVVGIVLPLAVGQLLPAAIRQASVPSRRALVVSRISHVVVCVIMLCVRLLFPLTSVPIVLRLIVLIVLAAVSRTLRRLLIVVRALRRSISGRLIVGHCG